MKIGDKVCITRSYKGPNSFIGMIGEVVYILSTSCSVKIEKTGKDPKTGTTVRSMTYISVAKRSLELVDEVDFLSPKTLRSAGFAPQRIEKPCGTCKQDNDLGVKTCWYCGNKP